MEKSKNFIFLVELRNRNDDESDFYYDVGLLKMYRKFSGLLKRQEVIIIQIYITLHFCAWVDKNNKK